MIRKNVIIFFVISIIILTECIIVLETGDGNNGEISDSIVMYMIEFLKLNIPTFIAIIANLNLVMHGDKDNKINKIINAILYSLSGLYYIYYEFIIFLLWFIRHDAK